jgi:hypothetical protein
MHRISGLLWVWLLALAALSCTPEKDDANYDAPLKAVWQFHKDGDTTWLPAYVPGDVLTELVRNKIADNPAIRWNEEQIKSVGLSDWEYRTVFDVGPEILKQDVVQLSFEGLDTYADVYLNDSLILKADNMFHTWKVDCKRLLKPVGNNLRIYFQSIIAAEKERYGNVVADSTCKLFTPHPGYLSGGDGKHCLINAGIWKPIRLVAWSHAVITDLHLHPRYVSTKLAEYTADFSIVSDKEQVVTVELLLNNKLVHEAKTLVLRKGENNRLTEFTVAKPKLWWTNGLGRPYLYDVTFRLKQGDTLLHEIHQRLGIRSIELVPTKNASSGGFYCKLNGFPLFLKGADFVPPDMLYSRISADDYIRIVRAASDANMNILKIWKGGIYEDDELYDLCDENGILVWQDCPVNNAKIVDTTHCQNKLTIAMEHTLRLRNHACLIPAGFFREELTTKANSNAELNEIKYAQYLPEYNKANYKIPVNNDVQVYEEQVAQGELLKTIIENQRMQMPASMSVVYNTIDEYLPGQDNATFSYHDRWKPAHFAVRSAFSHFLVVPYLEGDKVNIYVVSDSHKDMDAILLARLIDFDGNDLFVKQIPVTIKANTSRIVLSVKEAELLKKAEKTSACLVVELNQPNFNLSHNILYFVEPKKLELARTQIDVTINETVKGYNLILRTKHLAKNVLLTTDSIKCLFSDNNFDLLPGQRTKIPVRYSGTSKQLMKDLKIRSLGDVK